MLADPQDVSAIELEPLAMSLTLIIHLIIYIMKTWMFYIPIIGFVLAMIYWEKMPFNNPLFIALFPAYQGVMTGFPICLLIIYLVYGHL